jgi:hypothetical protein
MCTHSTLGTHTLEGYGNLDAGYMASTNARPTVSTEYGYQGYYGYATALEIFFSQDTELAASVRTLFVRTPWNISNSHQCRSFSN